MQGIRILWQARHLLVEQGALSAYLCLTDHVAMLFYYTKTGRGDDCG